MGLIRKYLDVAKRVRLWLWRNGRWASDKVHRLSGPLAGVMFILLIPLGLSMLQTWTEVSIPLIPPGTATTFWLFVGVIAVFGVFVVLETVAGILKWVFGLRLRLYEWRQSNSDD